MTDKVPSWEKIPTTAEERLKRVDAALAAQLSASIARNSLLQAQIDQLKQEKQAMTEIEKIAIRALSEIAEIDEFSSECAIAAEALEKIKSLQEAPPAPTVHNLSAESLTVKPPGLDQK